MLHEQLLEKIEELKCNGYSLYSIADYIQKKSGKSINNIVFNHQINNIKNGGSINSRTFELYYRALVK